MEYRLCLISGFVMVLFLGTVGCSVTPENNVVDLSDLTHQNTDSGDTTPGTESTVVHTQTDDQTDDTDTSDTAIFQPTLCAADVITPDVRPVALLFLVDLSGSMWGTAWTAARGAITGALPNYDQTNLHFGFDRFPDDGGCGTSNPVVLDCNDTDQQISQLQQLLPPDNAPSGSTPLFRAMTQFKDPDYAPIFANWGGARVLVVVSDGVDTCGDENYNGVTLDALVELTDELLDAGIQTTTIGFGDSYDADQLDAIASAGGTSFTTHLAATGQEALQEALDTIAGGILSCSFEALPAPAGVKANDVYIQIDGQFIRYNRTCNSGEGWNFDYATNTIRLCQKSCQVAQIPGNEVTVGWGCP